MKSYAAHVEWKSDAELVPYEEAIRFMEARVEAIHKGTAPECVWLLEHPPLYTAGTSAKDADLIDPRFPVFKTGRGGQYTYHGPGQRVAYVMIDLKKRTSCVSRVSGRLLGPQDPRFRGERSLIGPDIKKYVCDLERWIIAALKEFGVEGRCVKGRVGVWIEEKKIAAIGVRVRRWVTMHGISINVNPDLSHFSGIVPCGIADAGVTSLAELGVKAGMGEVDAALRKNFSLDSA